MSTPDPVPVQVAAIPWYQSPVQKAQITSAVSALIALSPKIGKFIGVSTPADAAVWVETIFGFITLMAPIIGSVVRAKSAIQPLTLTKAAAAVHPQTVAATAASATGVSNASPPASASPPAGSPKPS